MEYKSVASVVKSIEDRTVTGLTAVMGNIDDGGDRIFPGAFRKTLQEHLSRVKHLWQHDATQPPTAVIKDIREVGVADVPMEVLNMYPNATGALQVTREYLPTPRGEEILRGIISGAISEMSFGYDPIKFDFEEVPGKGVIRNLRECRLWDTSDVNWGMNPATVASKAAIPFKDTGKADESEPWSAPGLEAFSDESFGDLPESQRRRIAGHFAWSASTPPETFGDLKLPHHEASKSGIGPAVWRGVSAAMGALMGARGGVDIPDSDRQAVYTHLSRHYEQFGKEAPDFKFVELAYRAVTFQVDEFKSGRVLSASNVDRLKRALAELQDILAAAEPLEDPQKVAALTAQLLRKIKLAEHDPILLSVR